MTPLQPTVFDAPPETSGPWAGWVRIRDHDPFEDFVGPFYFRAHDDGRKECVLALEPHHLNGMGSAHGGCLMTLADLALFGIAKDALEGDPAVTVSMTSEFVGPGRGGQILRASGEVVKAGGSLVFVRGLIHAEQEVALAFTGVIKRLRRRPATEDPAARSPSARPAGVARP